MAWGTLPRANTAAMPCGANSKSEVRNPIDKLCLAPNHPGEVEPHADLAEVGLRGRQRVVAKLLLDREHGHAGECQVGRVRVS